MTTTPDSVVLDVENSGPSVTVRFRPDATDGRRVDRVAVNDGAPDRRRMVSETTDAIDVVCAARRTTRITAYFTRSGR